MKIAVPAESGSLDAKVDVHFGRGKCFVIVDADSWEFEVVSNEQNIQATAGAGIQAAQIVADHGADVLISANCGPNAFRTLKAANIQIFAGIDGTVREAVNAYKDGKLKPAGGANVKGHSGIQ